MKRTTILSVLAFAALTLASSLAMAEPSKGDHHDLGTSLWHAKTLKFDVAESMAKFVFDEAPVLPSGLPAYGNPFITQGYIYPYGTLESGNGVLADGSPEFPELVIGEWTCRGYLIGNGAETTTGPWVISTQHYDFYEETGHAEGKQSSHANLVSEGYELADVGVQSSRAVTGGTGKYRRARGEAEQSLLGFNASEGVSLRVKIKLR